MERKVPEDSNGTDGAQGPPGITQLINGTNVYLVTVQEFGETFIEASALCDSGDFVLNGGYNYDGALTTEFTDVFKDEPVISPAGGGWHVFIRGLADVSNGMTVNAYCFDNPLAHIP